MSLQNGRRGNCAKYIQLIQSVRAESHASALYSSIVYRHDFLSIPTEKLNVSCAIPLSSILRAHLEVLHLWLYMYWLQKSCYRARDIADINKLVLIIPHISCHGSLDLPTGPSPLSIDFVHKNKLNSLIYFIK